MLNVFCVANSPYDAKFGATRLVVRVGVRPIRVRFARHNETVIWTSSGLLLVSTPGHLLFIWPRSTSTPFALTLIKLKERVNRDISILPRTSWRRAFLLARRMSFSLTHSSVPATLGRAIPKHWCSASCRAIARSSSINWPKGRKLTNSATQED